MYIMYKFGYTIGSFMALNCDLQDSSQKMVKKNESLKKIA